MVLEIVLISDSFKRNRDLYIYKTRLCIVDVREGIFEKTEYYKEHKVIFENDCGVYKYKEGNTSTFDKTFDSFEHMMDVINKRRHEWAKYINRLFDAQECINYDRTF